MRGAEDYGLLRRISLWLRSATGVAVFVLVSAVSQKIFSFQSERRREKAKYLVNSRN